MVEEAVLGRLTWFAAGQKPNAAPSAKKIRAGVVRKRIITPSSGSLSRWDLRRDAFSPGPNMCIGFVVEVVVASLIQRSYQRQIISIATLIKEEF